MPRKTPLTIPCTVEGCGRHQQAKGLCQTHYKQMRRGQPFGVIKAVGKVRPCSIPGCRNNSSKGAGQLCGAHYFRLKNGRPLDTPLRTKPGTLQQWLRDHVAYEGDDCLFWPFYRYQDRRPLLSFNGHMMPAATAMCILRNGPRPHPSMDAAHSCGKGHLGCVNPNHMRWATKAENQADRILHGTDGRGERHPLHILTEGEVRTIRTLGLRGNGAAQRAAAEKFGVSLYTIQDVVLRRSWRHI